MIIKVPFDFDLGIPIIPDDIKERVRQGEQIDIEILPKKSGFVKNALKWGVAGLNIDGCRVEGPGWQRQDRESGAGFKTGKFMGAMGRGESTQQNGYRESANGRWPANLLLSHSPGCRRVGVRKVPSNERKRKGIAGRPKFNGVTMHSYSNAEDQTNTSPDGTETIPDWICTDDCAVRMLGEQSGERAGFKGFKPGAERKASRGKGGYHGNFPDALTTQGHNDKGTAARFFQQFDGEWECAEDCAVAALDRDSGESTSSSDPNRFKGRPKFNGTKYASDKYSLEWESGAVPVYGDTGGASRFFQRFTYQPKASRRSRELGLLGHIPCVKCGGLDSVTHEHYNGKGEWVTEKCHRNSHPTVKSLDLMRWLCRLTKTPTGGTIIDPFMGSGRTGIAAVLEGRSFIGIEQEQASFDVAEAGIRWAQEQAAEMVQPTMPGISQVTKL